MFVERHVVDVLTDAGGAVEVYSPTLFGRVLAIHYVKDGSNPFDDGVDFTITAEATGENLWVESNVNATKRVAPRMATHSTAGVAALFAAAGEPVLEPIPLARDRVKIVIAQGGNAKAGRFHIVVG